MKLSLMTFMCEIPMLMSGPWTQEKTALIEDLIRTAKDTGFTGIDMITSTIYDMGPGRVRELLRELGLQLTSMICLGRLADPDLPDEEAVSGYMDAIDLAADMDCPHLMLVPGKVAPGTGIDAVHAALKRRFQILVKKAAGKNVICMIEDDPDLRIGMCAAADVRDMLCAVPELKLVYDSANMIVAGEEPVSYYESLAEHMVHTHIKDISICEDPAMYRDEGLHGVFYASAPHGSGMVDFEPLFRSFQEHGYQGVLSLEYVPVTGPENIAADNNILKSSVKEDIRRVYRMFASLAARFSLGVNQVGLLGKLMSSPPEEVWQAIRSRGIDSVEICAIPDHSERIREYEQVIAAKYGSQGLPFARGDEIYALAEGIRSRGLDLYSCHLMLCEAYPEAVFECVPYMKEINRRTGIGQFVISCMFDSASKTKEFLPFLQRAAQELKEDGIILCYHNHHQDCLPLENGKTAMDMVLEECPDCMLQLDIGWAWYGNMDARKFMTEHGDRITSVHLKDLTEDSRQREDAGRFTAVGSGSVPTGQALDDLHLCSIAPGRLIIDQDASAGDMYDDIAAGAAFVHDWRGALK